MRVGIHVVSLFLVCLGVACTTIVDVMVDEREDFSRYQTWNWSPPVGPSVDAPAGRAPMLDARLVRLVEGSLRERGFERAGEGADFFVAYHLRVERRAVKVDQPFASYTLDSHHSSPSYQIEGTNTVTRIYDDIRLGIGVSNGRGRITWQGWLEQRVEAGNDLPLDAAVAKRLSRFPARVPD